MVRNNSLSTGRIQAFLGQPFKVLSYFPRDDHPYVASNDYLLILPETLLPMPPVHDEQQLHHGQVTWLNRFQNYLGEFVYGGMDGSVTTFAVVAGAVGANLDSVIIIILGFANLLADGFAMSVGAYLSAKSEKDTFDKHRRTEYWEVDNIPEAERQEIREIYENKGFSGPLLEQVVEVITADRDRWVDTMMKEELEMIDDQRSPVLIGAVTYMSFLAIGLIPLLIYVWDYTVGFPGDEFFWSSILTFSGFAFIGFLKTYVTETSIIRGIVETVLLGALAAAVAYFVGDLLEKIVVG